jgi:A/G-specific adenine glycosylase
MAALMDLGQLVCTSRRPDCGRCPLAGDCLAARQGSPETYPPRAAAPRKVEICLAAACVRRDGRALLLRRGGRLLGGLWEFPSAEGKTPGAARRSLALKARRLGIRLTSPSIGQARHTMVNRRLSIEVFPARSNSQFPILNSQLSESRWFTAAELARAAVPTLTRKVARASGFF